MGGAPRRLRRAARLRPRDLAARLTLHHPGGIWQGLVEEVLRGETWGLRVRIGPLVGADPSLVDVGATAPGLRHLDDGVTELDGLVTATGAPAAADSGSADDETADALDVGHAAALAGATDVTVILRGPGAVPAAVAKALPEGTVAERFPVPTGSAAATRIGELAARAGVTLSGPARELLVERGAHDLPRVAGVMAQLTSMGLLEPEPAHLEAMLGTSAAPGVPWALTDMLESGDVAGALELAATLEPVAVVNYLASRTGQLGHVVDEGLSDPDAIAGAFGMASRFPAVKLGGLAARLGPRGVAASWDLVSAADRGVKVAPDPRAGLDLLVVRLAGLWGGTGTVDGPLPLPAGSR